MIKKKKSQQFVLYIIKRNRDCYIIYRLGVSNVGTIIISRENYYTVSRYYIYPKHIIHIIESGQKGK